MNAYRISAKPAPRKQRKTRKPIRRMAVLPGWTWVDAVAAVAALAGLLAPWGSNLRISDCLVITAILGAPIGFEARTGPWRWQDERILSLREDRPEFMRVGWIQKLGVLCAGGLSVAGSWTLDADVRDGAFGAAFLLSGCAALASLLGPSAAHRLHGVDDGGTPGGYDR